MTEGTLVYLFQDSQVLLAMKKRGLGEGKWNGPGGKMEVGETPGQTGIREVQEELGVTPILTKTLGVITYHDPKFGDWKVHVFRTNAWRGQPHESEEMRPQWFDINNIPYDLMWSGDDQWVPWVIRNKSFIAEVWGTGDGGVRQVLIKERK